MQEPVIKKTSRNSFRKGFRTFILVIVAIIALAIYWFYFNVKSNGDRKGVLIKFSHKGNIFKTDEGEMWLGCRQTVNAEKYFFSVTNDSVAAILKNLQDECLQLEYKEYRAKLPWRGESRYIVYGVKKIEPHFSQ
jgi:Na+/melibiose symporter-like transporter